MHVNHFVRVIIVVCPAIEARQEAQHSRFRTGEPSATSSRPDHTIIVQAIATIHAGACLVKAQRPPGPLCTLCVVAHFTFQGFALHEAPIANESSSSLPDGHDAPCAALSPPPTELLTHHLSMY